MTIDDRRARGREIFHRVYDGTIPVPVESGNDPYTRHMLDHLFAEVWAREVLSIRDRRLLILGALMATGEADMFTIHARSAVRLAELDADQLREVLTFMIHYIGYPQGSKFRQAIEAVLAEE